MITLEWLNKNNVQEMTEIALDEFKDDMETVGDDRLYYDVLEGKTIENKTDLNYALIKNGDESVGVTGYYMDKTDPDAAWLGWFVIKPEYRHLHYGKESIDCLIKYLKEKHPELKYLRTYTDDRNNGAISFYLNYGFIKEQATIDIDGEDCRTVILDYSLKGDPIVEWDNIPIW